MSELMEQTINIAEIARLKLEHQDEVDLDDIERLLKLVDAQHAEIERLRSQLVNVREALKDAREHIQADIDEISPGWRSAQRLVEQINAALIDDLGNSK